MVASVLDAVHARIAKNYVRGQFLTEGGDYEKQQRAKKLTQYGEGLQYETKWHDEIAQRVFLDSLIYDGGVAHILGDEATSTVRAERWLPYEVLVDEVEAMYGKPRHMYVKRYASKDVIKANPLLNPRGKNSELIDRAAIEDPTEDAGISFRAHDMIPLYVGWRLPSAPGRDDGATLVSIREGALTKVEKWDRPRFPVQIYRWKQPESGFWGSGLVADLVGIQVELNHLLIKIQRAMRFSVPMWMVPGSAEVVDSELTNETMGILQYKGPREPKVSTPATVHPEMFSQIDRLFEKAFEIAGISQMSATSQKPAGVSAAVALQTLQDIETQRFVLPAKRWE